MDKVDKLDECRRHWRDPSGSIYVCSKLDLQSGEQRARYFPEFWGCDINRVTLPGSKGHGYYVVLDIDKPLIRT